MQPDPPPTGLRPYEPEIEAERRGWDALQALIRRLTPSEREAPGYYRDPDWSVRDLLAHIGTWIAQAEIELQRIAAGTYDGPPDDIDALNARFLAAMRDQPWSVVSTQAQAARVQMLHAWFEIRKASAEAAWWIRKSGADHYDEHLARLDAWVGELEARRSSGRGEGP